MAPVIVRVVIIVRIIIICIRTILIYSIIFDDIIFLPGGTIPLARREEGVIRNARTEIEYRDRRRIRSVIGKISFSISMYLEEYN